MKKTLAFLFISALFAASLSAQTTVTLGAVVVSDYGSMPDYKEVLAAPFGQRPLEGFEWEVAIDRVGFGGTYAVNFSKDAAANWWLDWYGIPLFASYHVFGTGDFLDPFVEAGIGCVGRVFTSTGSTADPRLLLGLFPALTAGLDIDLQPLVVGGKVTWVPGVSEIPCTSIPGQALGGIQIAFTLGYRLGVRD